jgi:hypothetical protein
LHTQILSPDYLFSSQTGAASNYFTALTVAFGVIFVGSAIVYWRRGKLARQNAIFRRLLRRSSTSGMWSAGTGLFLALMRYAEIPYLSAPILMLLLIVLMIYLVGYYVYDLSERYPLAVHRLQQSAIEQRYRPVGRMRTEPQKPRPPRTRGKRRK